MSEDPGKNGNFVQHEFGCGVQVRFEEIEFYDWLKIWIPREADNSVHNCPKLPNNEEHEDWNVEEFYPEDPDLYEDVKKYHLTFIDIIEQFPDGTLRDIMNTVDLSDVSMAMKGVDQEIVDRIIGNLPQKKQAMYEPEEGPRPKRDVDTARKKVVDVARQMEKDGQFNVADLLGGGEMVE